MFKVKNPSIHERREDFMLVFIALVVPVATLSSMLGF